jgi:probable addiction module antidote protein
MTKTMRFDAADYLDTEERRAAYLAAALESADADFVRDALGLVARARGTDELDDRDQKAGNRRPT